MLTVRWFHDQPFSTRARGRVEASAPARFGLVWDAFPGDNPRVPPIDPPDPHRAPGALARWCAGRRLAALAFLVALVATAFAALRPDVVLFGVDTMAARQPFAGALERPVEVANPALADQGQVFYPYYRWVAESWLAGDAPWWNPFVYAGAPGHANAQAGALDPQVAVLVALEALGGRRAFDWGLGLLATLRLAAAFAGTVLLARRLGLGGFGALFAGAGFALSGFQLLWLNHSLGHVTPFLPWLLLAIEGVAAGRRWAGPWVALLLAGAVLGGHPETSFYVGFAAGLWALAVAWRNPARGARALVALAGGALISAVLLVPFVEYLGLSAAETIRATHARASVPALQLFAWFCVAALGAWFARLGARGGVDWESRRGWPLAVAGLTLAAVGAALLVGEEWLARAALVLAPERFGPPQAYSGPANFLEGASPWLAAPVLALALVGILGPGRLARRRLIAGLGVVALLLALEAPGLHEAYRWVPVVGLGATVRLAAVSALCLSLLAGDALESSTRPARSAAFALLAVAFGALAAPGSAPAEFTSPPAETDELIGITVRPTDVLTGGDSMVELWIAAEVRLGGSPDVAVVPLDEHGRPSAERKSFSVPVEPVPPRAGAPPAARWFRTTALVTSRLPAGRWRFELSLPLEEGGSARRLIGESLVARPVRRAWGSLAFLGATLLGLVLFERVRWAFPALAVAQGVLLALVANPRVPREACFPPTATGRILRELQTEGQRVFADASVLPPATGLVEGLFHLQGYDGLDPRRFNLYRLEFQRAANGLLGFTPRGVDLTHPAFRMLGVGQLLLRDRLDVPGFELVAGPGEERFAEVFVYRALEPAPRAWIADEVVDLDELKRRARAGLDLDRVAGLESEVAWRPVTPVTSQRVRDVTWTNNTVSARVELDGDGLFVVSDLYFPGWVAEVDGAAREVVPVNFAFRGVPLEAGRHEVVLRYRPRSLVVGAWLALAGCVLALATALGFRR
ncbi:MAG: YfhO family protein [Planctomycetota bacterium]